MIRIMKYGEVPNEEIFARSMPTMNVTDKVAEILKNVRERGDDAPCGNIRKGMTTRPRTT